MERRKNGLNICPELFRILKYLPGTVSSAIGAFSQTLPDGGGYLSEIRLRAGAPVSVTYLDRNVCLFDGKTIVCSESEVAGTLQRLCEDSVHTYGETIKEGFVALENGYRIGVVGRAGSEKENIKSVYGISSLSIRIPHSVSDVSGEALQYVRSHGKINGTLFYSPPNVGKTTLIRDIAKSLSSGRFAHRVAIVDTRGEIYIKTVFENSIADVLSGYPRAKGIEIATRTMSPEVIICDEIGTLEEAKAILSAQNSGVPLIATAHADSFDRLMKRPNIKTLYDNGIFRYYIGISRAAGATRFAYDVIDTEMKERGNRCMA